MILYRADNLLDLKVVQNTTIAILGQGSLGSLVTSLLAYPWKSIILIDPETLEVKNVERHQLGLSQVGKYKVDGMAEWLIDRGVDPRRIVRVTDMKKEMEAIEKANILVVSVDNAEACHAVNQVSVNLGIPAVYGGVYPGGTGGQVVIVPDPAQACYYCAEKKMGALDYKGKPANGDYGVDPMSLSGKSGVVQAVPALKYAIAAIASDMALAVMDILTGTAETQVLIHAQKWEDVLNLRPGAGLQGVSGYISTMPDTGIVPNMKLTPRNGKLVLSVKQGTVGLKLARWQECPAHSGSTSPDMI